MTKLQLLHRALNERLMAAVEQIMEMVGGTVLEYEVETVRARKENEELRRRLRWMEGENPTAWPEIEIDTSGSGQPVIVIDEPVQNCPSIEIEPIDVSDLQSLIPDASLAAAVSIRSADLEIIPPVTTEATNSGISNRMEWDSSLSYMAPLDSDPTVVKQRGGRSRSKKMSYACLHCGKVFEREQRLIFHMRIHSADRPYACRSRKACFYGDRKRKKKVHGLSNVFPSREFVGDNAAKSTGPATVSNPVAAACSSVKAGPEKANKRSEITVVKPVGRRRRRRRGPIDNMPQCLECKRVFTKPSSLAMHMKIHRRPPGNQKEQDVNDKMNKINKKSLEHPEKPVARTKVMEVEKAKGGGHTLPQSSESHKQEHAVAHKGQKKKQNLSNNPESNISKVSPQLPKEDKQLTEPSNVRTDDSATASKLSEAKNDEASKINLELKSKSRRRKKRSRKMIPEESAEDTGGIQKPKKLYSCHVCGKSYILPGWLITHERTHIAERLQKEKEKREQMKIKRLIEKQKLVEKDMKNIVEKKLNEMQKSIKIRETENQDTSAIPSELGMEKLKDKVQKNGDLQTQQQGLSLKFSTIQNGNDGGKPSYTCPLCGKDFRHRSQVTVHMQSHIGGKRYSSRQRKELFYGERKRHKVPDSSSHKPGIRKSERNGGFAATQSQTAMSHTSPLESTESIEPQSVCSERDANLLPRQSFSATSSCIASRPTNFFRLQPRIVLQPVCVKSRICSLPEERDLKSVKTDRSAHGPITSSQPESLPKQQVSDLEPISVAFSDVDSSDDNDWSDVLHNLDEDLSQEQTAPEKLADVETVDISHPETSEKASDAASDEELIPKSSEEQGVHDDLTGRDDIVATSVQVTGKHGSSTCMICGLKFASKPSLSQHMQIHFSSGNTRRSVNSKANAKQQVGQEQTPESQEVSTNFPEIKQEMDFATVIEEKTSQSSGGHPNDMDTSTRSKEGSETGSKSRKPNKESMERKYLHCCFCGKACRTIELHLKFDHPREPKVMDALRRAKNAEERKRLLSGLCTLKSSESDKKDAALNEDLVHCLFCQGSYRRNQFWKHALVCEQKKAEGASTVSDAAHSVCTTKPSPENGPSKAQEGLEEQINDSTFNTAQDNLSEELTNAPVPEDHPSTVQTVADPHKADSSSDVQKTDSATADPFIHVSGNSKNLDSDLKSGCSPVQGGHSSETHRFSDPETNQVEEEMGKNDEDTGKTGSDLGLRPGSDCTTVLKRKLDSQDSEFTEAKTMKMMESDPSQPERVDNNLLDEAEAASQSMKTHNCPHCSATFYSPHQCTCSGDTPPSLDQNRAKKHETLDKGECCTTTSETSIPTEENM